MMKIGNKVFDTDNQTYIMGILNVTPDSFFDGGHYNIKENALRHAEKLVNEGVDIIDVGGESTRPGHVQITEEEEIERVAPVIELLKSNFDVPLSIDSYKSKVVKAACQAGADMINDIWGFKYDRDIAKVAADYNVCCCLMHNRENNDYSDFLNDLINDIRDSVSIAKFAGVSDDRIMIDPGIGFAKDTAQNLLITKHIGRLKDLGYPILYAASNKSFIGNILDAAVDKRLVGTLATTAWAVSHGCSFIRVHQVMENKQVTQMIKAIMGGV